MSEPRIRIEDALRNYAQMSPGTPWRSRCEEKAADEIQSLRQRVERLEGALRGIVDHFDKCDDGNAPGHAHSIPGIWDSDNHPAIAGKTCEWCAHWAEAYAALSPKVQEGE